MRNRLPILFFILFGLEFTLPPFQGEFIVDFAALLIVSVYILSLLARRSYSKRIHWAKIVFFVASLAYVGLLIHRFSLAWRDPLSLPTDDWRAVLHAWYFLTAIIVGLSTPGIIRFFSQLQQHPPRFISIVYTAAAVASTLLLVLPISLQRGVQLSYLDAFFTSVSALSGAGLVVANTALTFSFFGKFVLLVVIQAGGIGIITFSGILLLLIGRELGLRERVIQDDLERLWFFGSLKKFVGFVSVIVFIVEGLGALLLFPYMREVSSGFWEALFNSVFQSVSAFCTAGFTTLPDGMVTPQLHHMVLIVMGALSIVGMLGMPTILNMIYLFNPRHGIRRLGAYAKMELSMALGLMLFGTITLFFVEMGNPIYVDWVDRLIDSFFQSSQRAAGFNSVVIADMSIASIFVLISLMIVAGAPMSTAGGLKTATVGTIIVFVISFLKGKSEASFANRRLPPLLLTKAVSLLVIYFVVLFIGFILLFFSERATGIEILFETISALSVVGFSLGITPELSSFGKATIIVLMMIGRIGILTAVYSLLQGRKPERYRYPVGDFYVG